VRESLKFQIIFMLLFTILVELRDRTCGYLVTLIHIYLLGIVTIDSKQY